MEFVLYTENANDFIQSFQDLLYSDDITFTLTRDSLLGKSIILCSDKDIFLQLSNVICDFLIENYYNRFIFNKLYDEYNITSVDDAAHILVVLLQEIKKSTIYEEIKYFFNKSKCFNFDSYILFRKEFLITKINYFINFVCDKLICENNEFILQSSMSYYNGFNKNADAEMSSDHFDD